MDEARRQLIAGSMRESIAARRAAGTYEPPQVLVTTEAQRYIARARGRGLSYRRIAEDLAALRIAPPRARRWPYSTVRKVALRASDEAAGLSATSASP